MAQAEHAALMQENNYLLIMQQEAENYTMMQLLAQVCKHAIKCLEMHKNA